MFIKKLSALGNKDSASLKNGFLANSKA